MTKTATPSSPSPTVFEFETEEGLIRVDTSEEIGELTRDEFRLASEYVYVETVVKEDGLDAERAKAGAAVLILLSRKVSIPHDELLKRVVE